jgi:hypothetical protein
MEMRKQKGGREGEEGHVTDNRSVQHHTKKFAKVGEQPDPRTTTNGSSKKVTHEEAATMTRMENPSCGLRQRIRRIHYTRYVMHKNVAIILPILNRKRSNVKVARTIGRAARIDNLDGRSIINVYWCWEALQKSQIQQNSTEVFGRFCSRDCGNELNFSRTGEKLFRSF